MKFSVKKNMTTFGCLLLAFFSGVQVIFAQGMPGGGQGNKESLYFDNRYFESKESHYNIGAKIPIWKKKSFSHELSVQNNFSNLNNDAIRAEFDEDQFDSTTVSWTYKQNREDKMNFPFASTLSYQMNGNKFFKNSRNNLAFKLMTGHRSGKSMHNYGIAMSSNGAFRGVPFPFYVYSTKWGKQNLTLGFPFISLSGPRESLTNYQVSLSPMGASLKGIQKFGEKAIVNISWSYTVDSYIIDNDHFSERESLLIEKQKIEADWRYQLSKVFSLNLSGGREYARRFFKGQNIFNKEDSRFDMVSSNFIKTGVGFVF